MFASSIADLDEHKFLPLVAPHLIPTPRQEPFEAVIAVRLRSFEKVHPQIALQDFATRVAWECVAENNPLGHLEG